MSRNRRRRASPGAAGGGTRRMEAWMAILCKLRTRDLPPETSRLAIPLPPRQGLHPLAIRTQVGPRADGTTHRRRNPVEAPPPQRHPRRRLRLRLPLGQRFCRCGAELDPYGDHLAACPKSGLLKRRAMPQERTWRRIFTEAGAVVQKNQKLADMQIEGVSPMDDR